MMREAFLHYLWKYQYFHKEDLKTTSGDSVDVFHPGLHNTDAGPDFKEARIQINAMEWRGQVEIHRLASDWRLHGHQNDTAYNNVILHVVWKEDKPIYRKDGTLIPTVELTNRVDEKLYTRYEKLINSPDEIPCSGQTHKVKDLTKLSAVESAAVERLNSKSARILEINKANKNDWEETTYQLLAENFGVKINKEPFFRLAQSLPYKVLRKHADQPVQVEALLFGQAALLTASKDEYQQKLKREFQFLKAKYNLEQKIEAHHWKFARLRPANFPTIRLAQLASVICTTQNLFGHFAEVNDISEIYNVLHHKASTYWDTHYTFNRESQPAVKKPGKATINVICINTVVPLIAAYAQYIDSQLYMDRAIDLLQQIAPEKNKIVSEMHNAGFESKNAFDTQGLIQLHNEYCLHKKCLTCAVGTALIGS